MAQKIIHLDQLTDICGHFYFDHENRCNSGYNCNHPDCDDKELFKNGTSVYLYEVMRSYCLKKYKKMRLRCKKHKELSLMDISLSVKILGLKEVGRCFSFSCPIACRADLDDMKELDPELAEEFEDEDESALDADYMVVDGELADKC